MKINHNMLFGDAAYQINKNRQIKLRKPQELPLDVVIPEDTVKALMHKLADKEI